MSGQSFGPIRNHDGSVNPSSEGPIDVPSNAITRQVRRDEGLPFEPDAFKPIFIDHFPTAELDCETKAIKCLLKLLRGNLENATYDDFDKNLDACTGPSQLISIADIVPQALDNYPPANDQLNFIAMRALSQLMNDLRVCRSIFKAGEKRALELADVERQIAGSMLKFSDPVAPTSWRLKAEFTVTVLDLEESKDCSAANIETLEEITEKLLEIDKSVSSLDFITLVIKQWTGQEKHPDALERAKKWCQKADSLLESLTPYEKLLHFESLATAFLTLNLGEARRNASKALELAMENGMEGTTDHVRILSTLAKVALRSDREVAAGAFADQALQVARNLRPPSKALLNEIKLLKANILDAQHRYAEASELKYQIDQIEESDI